MIGRIIFYKTKFVLSRKRFLFILRNTTRNSKILFTSIDSILDHWSLFIVINYSYPCDLSVWTPYLTYIHSKNPCRVVRMKHSSRRVCFTLWSVIMRGGGGVALVKHTFSNKENNQLPRLEDSDVLLLC